MRKKLSRIVEIVLVAALAACALFAICGCSGNGSSDTEADLPPVRIGTLATEDILPMWVAEERGLFEAAGIDAEIIVFQSATELIAAVSAGEVDYAMTDPMVAASLHASGAELKVEWITLGTDSSQGRFGIMTSDPSIRTLADLKGKSIGVGSNTILEYVMDNLLEDAGISPDEVKVEELQKLPVRYESMASGTVAAAALPASLLALGESAGYNTIADDTQGDNISQSIMVARVDYLSEGNGAATEDALARVWNDAAKMINDNPEDFRELLVQKASLSDEVANSYPICTYPQAVLPTSAMIDPVLEWMHAKGYLEVNMSYNPQDGTFSID
ncbi:MAG: ABC transporter substrate-binding protein [Coriobacteriales bacterium]|nr:ABC transporter substrate-binding protein [Coriobacteriales bacterium]